MQTESPTAMVPRRRGRKLPPITLNSLTVFFALLACCEGVTDGAVRWILSLVDLGVLVYLRDGSLALAVIFGLVSAYRKNYVTTLRLVFALGAVVVLWTLIGQHFDGNWLQSIFGLKTYLPLFAGILTSRAFFRNRAVFAVLVVLWIVAVTGVALSAVTDLPWKGASYAIGDEEIQGQREWTINGVDRLAGFARASPEAATQIGLLGVVLMCYTGTTLRVLIWLASVGAIYLTTSRTELLALLFGTVTLVACTSRRLRPLRKGLMWFPLAPAALVMVCMFFPSLVSFVGNLGSSGVLATESFVTRGEALWKDAWDMQIHRGSIPLGLGIGGVGTAQKYYAPLYYNTCDNSFVYIEATFGVVATAVFLLFATVFWDRTLLKTPVESVLPLVAAAYWFGVGTNANAIEDGFLFFVVTATWMDPAMRQRLRRPNELAPVETPEAVLQLA